MKKIFLTGVLTFSSLTIADIKKDPISGAVFSLPGSKKINLFEYNALFLHCAEIESRVEWLTLDRKVLLSHIERYLKGIGTPTALRH